MPESASIKSSCSSWRHVNLPAELTLAAQPVVVNCWRWTE